MKLPTKIQFLLFAAIMAVFSPGCADLRDLTDEMYTSSLNRELARNAWNSLRHIYHAVPYPKHFRAGFLDGYVNIASGNNGCLPPLPPRQYWGFCYNTCEGQEKIRAWYEGYTYGVVVAEQDGVAHWTALPTSLFACCEDKVEEIGDPAQDAQALNPEGELAPAPVEEIPADELPLDDPYGAAMPPLQFQPVSNSTSNND